MRQIETNLKCVVHDEKNFVSNLLQKSISPTRVHLQFMLEALEMSIVKDVDLNDLTVLLLFSKGETPDKAFANFEHKDSLIEILETIANNTSTTAESLLFHIACFAERFDLSNTRFNFEYLSERLGKVSSVNELEEIAHAVLLLVPQLPSLEAHGVDRIYRTSGTLTVAINNGKYSDETIKRISDVVYSSSLNRDIIDSILHCDIYSILICLCIIGSKVKTKSEQVI